MKFLPIVERELRLVSRRRMTYWSRTVFALIAIAIGVFIYLAGREQQPHEVGTVLFDALAGASFSFCLLAGVVLTADCLSWEKREGTLGLLFLTDLKGYDIVLGKLAATSFGGLYGLLAVLPVLAITLLLGGVTQDEFWRVALVLSNSFFLSLAAGIFVSAVSRKPIRAMAVTFFIVILLNVGLPGLAIWLSDHSHPAGDVLFDLTPPAAFVYAFANNYQGHLSDFWLSSGVTLVFACSFVALACLIAPRSWQDKGDASATGWRAFWRKWNLGGDLERKAFRKRLLDINAFYWLAGRVQRKPAYVWGFLGLQAVLWFWAWREWGRDWLNPGCFFLTISILNVALKASLALEAGQQLGESRKMGALELLLSTPLSERDIVRGQFLSLRRQFFGPVLMALAIETIFLVASLRDSSFDATAVGFWLAAMTLLIADMIALSWVGMWVALKSKNPNFTAIGAFMRIVFLPNTAFVMFYILAVVSNHGRDPDGDLMLLIWFLLRLGNDLVFALNARSHLQTDFRRIAMERFMPSESRFRRWIAKAD